jgi:hypothetical protein
MVERESERDHNSGRFKNPATRFWVYKFLCTRDGSKCVLCGASDKEKELVIDHIDENPMNWSPENLRLLCRSCNGLEFWRNMKQREPPKNDLSHEMTIITPKRERARSMGMDGERNDNLLEQETTGSLELKINRDKEPAFRGWVMQKLIIDGRLSVRDAVNGGAEKIEISPLTARRYLQKMASSEGPLTIVSSKNEGRYVKIRAEYWQKLERQEAP